LLRILGSAALLASVLVGLAGAPATAEPTGGFGAAPANPNPNDPATRAYFKAVLAPGQSYTDEVLVTSTSDTALSLLISPVDGLTGQTSGAVYANREAPVKKAGTWVTPSISALSLAPHSQALVPFRVAAPNGATPGDHLAGIAVENANPQQAGAGQFAVTEVFRTVIGVDVTVPGAAEPQVRLGKLTLKALPGTKVATLTIVLGDSGRKLVKPLVAVSLRGPANYRRKLTRQLDTILPGDTIHYPFIWPDSLSAGTYYATVRATGGVSPVSVAATLQLGKTLRGATNPNLPSTGHDWRWLVLLGITIGLVVLIGLVTWRAQRRRRRPPGAIGRPSPPPSGGRASRRRARRNARRGHPADEALEPVRWRAGASR
jgi:hypothetical protein